MRYILIILLFISGAAFSQNRYVIKTGTPLDTTGTGALYIRNTTTQEDKRFNVRAGRLDSLLSASSAGLNLYSNNGTLVATLGAGGGANATFQDGTTINGQATLNSSVFLDKNDIPITTTNQWLMTVDTSTNRVQRIASPFTGNINNNRLLFSASGQIKDTSILSYDRANQRVGIGTASPGYTLDVRASTGARLSGINIRNTNTTGYSSLELGNNGSNFTQLFFTGTGYTPLSGIRADGTGFYNNGVGGFSFVSENATLQAFSFHVGTFLGGNPEAMRIEADGDIDIGGAASPPASAKFSVTSTTKGFLPPRMTATQRNAISTPAAGLIVYDTDSSGLMIYNTAWRRLVMTGGTENNLTKSRDSVTSSSGVLRYVDTFQYRKMYEYHDEFISAPSTVASNLLTSTAAGTSAGSFSTTTDAENRVGIGRVQVGTTTTGRVALASNFGAARLGGGEWIFDTDINLVSLSNATDRYQFAVGFFDVATAINQTDGVYLLYDEGGVSTGSAASANWQIVTSSNSVRTFTTSSTAVATGWVNVRIVVNAAATLATYYINGVSIGTINTNLPTGSGRELGFGYTMLKSAGTNIRWCDIDYLNVRNYFTTAK